MAARTLRFNLRSTLAPAGTIRAEESSGLLSTPIQATANASVPCAVRSAPLRLPPAVRPVLGNGLARLTGTKPKGYQALGSGDGGDDRPPRLPPPIYARPLCWAGALAVVLLLVGGVAAILGLLLHRRETPLMLAKAQAAARVAAPVAPLLPLLPRAQQRNATRPTSVRVAARRRPPPPPAPSPPPIALPTVAAVEVSSDALLSVHAQAGGAEIATDVGSGVVAQSV